MPENPSTIDKATLIEVLNGRREFYLALAGFFFKPLTQEQIDTMAKTDYTQIAVGEPMLEEGFNDITRYLKKRNTGTRQMLAVDYTSSFGGAATYQGYTAVPFASVYLSKEGLMSQEPRAEVFRVYRSQMLRVTKTSTSDDHLSVMLEFLAVMSDRCAEALQENRLEDARSYLVESRSFIKDHILSWYDVFAERALLLIQARFYRGVLKITKGYLLLDLQTIDDLLEEMV